MVSEKLDLCSKAKGFLLNFSHSLKSRQIEYSGGPFIFGFESSHSGAKICLICDVIGLIPEER